jgi:hypothetical protein
MSVCAHLSHPTTALTSLELHEPHPFAAVVKLARDDQAEQVVGPTAHGALHWAPLHDNGFQARMQAIANWIALAQPDVLVADVSVEIAAFVRLLGVPVVLMALPGDRVDAPHQLAHRLADHIVAAWPEALYTPAWLRPYANKTSFVGGISRFEGLKCIGHESMSRNQRILVLGGGDESFGGGADHYPEAGVEPTWTTLGGTDGRWVDDPWPQICAADIVVTHAGQGCIADIAAAKRRAVVIPQSRPFGEQRATAEVLSRHGLAAVADNWPDTETWPRLLAQAMAGDPHRWDRWQVQGAAARAAAAIEYTAQCCAAGART